MTAPPPRHQTPRGSAPTISSSAESRKINRAIANSLFTPCDIVGTVLRSWAEMVKDEGVGLPSRLIDALGVRYEDDVYRRTHAGDTEEAVRRELDAALRHQLREEYGVFPEFIELELSRVIEAACRPIGKME